MLFTSIFDFEKISERERQELNLLIFKLHAYRISLIILGYELCDSACKGENDHHDNHDHAHAVLGTSPQEKQLFDFFNRVVRFDIKKVKKEYLDRDGTYEISFDELD